MGGFQAGFYLKAHVQKVGFAGNMAFQDVDAAASDGKASEMKIKNGPVNGLMKRLGSVESGRGLFHDVSIRTTKPNLMLQIEP